jgi:hypothetical protein
MKVLKGTLALEKRTNSIPISKRKMGSEGKSRFAV